MRAISPVVGTALIVLITVSLATVVGATVLALPGATNVPPAVAVTADVTTDDGTATVALLLTAGNSLDVRTVDLEISVDGDPLADQPPVPFFSAAGFRSGPTGPFNSAADPTWSTGERASLVVARSNSPTIDPGDRIRIRIVVGGSMVADIEAVAT